MRTGLRRCVAACAMGLLISPAAEANLPANQWIERPTSGWKGKDYYGPVLCQGFASAGDRGILIFDMRDAGRAVVRKLDAATGTWTELASAPLDVDRADVVDGKGRENLHGVQLCYDPDRNVLVGVTSTDLGGRGRTVEFDLDEGTATGLKPDPSPPVLTAASLCYDPVNREILLATGGFSPIGGTGGTWLYDGARQEWRPLAGPKEVDEVRLPLEKARDRLLTLRWLAWKNLEFRATGREKLLDERSTGEALAEEAAGLAGEIKGLAELAGKNAAKAQRPYHENRLAAAGELLRDAAEKLAGAGGKLPAAGPEDLEAIYRGTLVPALEAVEKAASELAVTPQPRMSARLVYDSKNKLIVCFGGDGQDRQWADTWVYHCEGRWWERRHPEVHPPPGSARAVAFDPKSGLTVCLEALSKWGHHVGWQTWGYDAAADEWRAFDLAADPGIFWLEYDAAAGCLVGLNLDLNKAWLLRLDPAAAKRREADSAPEVALRPIDGEYVLRDAATLAELKEWHAQQEAWAAGVPANTWVSVPTRGTGRPNWGRSWSSIVYDPDRRQLYYRDGGHGSYHGSVTDHYDIPTGRWFRSDRRHEPPWPMGTYFAWGRSFSLAPWAIHTYKYCLFYNPLGDRLQRVIGQSGRLKGEGPESVLEYDPDTGLWSRGLRRLPAAVGSGLGSPVAVPGVPDALVGVDNFTRYNQKNGEAWRKNADGSVERWSDLGVLPRAYNDHYFCFFFDPKRKRVMYYGGPDDPAGQRLFALDMTAEAPKWQDLGVEPARGQKLPLSSREVVYVPRHDVFLMIAGRGGTGRGGPLRIVALDPESNTWRDVEPAVAEGVDIIDAGVSQGLQYDPVTDLCYFIGIAEKYRIMWYGFRYAPAG